MNLMDMVKGQLTDVVLQKIGSSVGLSTGETTRALDAIIPTQLGSIINMASNPSGAQNLMNLAGNFASLGNISGLLGQADGMQNLLKMGQTLLPTLFGNKLGEVVGAISSHTGFKNGAINTLMSIAGPMIMGTLGNQIKTQGLNAMGLVSMLGGLKGAVNSALPASLGSLVGMGNLAGMAGMAAAAGQAVSGAAGQAARGASTIAGNVTQAAGQTANRRGGLGWLLPAALVLLLGGGLAWLLNRPLAPAPATTTTESAPATTDTTSQTTNPATTDTTTTATTASSCTTELSLVVQDGATVTQPFRFGGAGSGQGYNVTIKRADGRIVGSKDLPLDSSCNWGYDSLPGRGQITYELRPIGAATSDAPVQTLTLTVN